MKTTKEHPVIPVKLMDSKCTNLLDTMNMKCLLFSLSNKDNETRKDNGQSNKSLYTFLGVSLSLTQCVKVLTTSFTTVAHPMLAYLVNTKRSWGEVYCLTQITLQAFPQLM